MYEYFLKLEPHSDGIQDKTLCPFHRDSNPSFFVDPDDKWWCFGCGEGGGPILFLQRFLGLRKETAQYVYDFYKEHDRSPLPSNEQVEKYHQVLMQEDELISYFQQMGVGINLLEEFKIGWDIQSRRIVFPIPSRFRPECYVNLRKYRPAGLGARDSKLINLSHLGDTIYYPYKAFDEDEIYIVEGEKDMIVARGLGLNSITGTGGTTIPDVDTNLFRNKKVYIMTDNDEPGEKIARKYLEALDGVVKEIHRIRLPEKDISDAIASYKDINVKDFLVDPEEFLSEELVEDASIKEMMHPENSNKVFKGRNLRIIGEDMTSFQVPTSAELSDGQIVNVEHRKLLSFVGWPDNLVDKEILRGQDDDVKIVSRKDVMAQMVYFRPDINVYENDLESGDYSNIAGMYISDQGETLKTNRVYDMEMIRTVHPKTQENMFVILDAKEAIMDEEINLHELEYFTSDDPIEELMEKYYRLWSPHLEVNGRQDLFEAMLLTYVSVLEFKWRNSIIKGRLDTIVIGDTRTGKTKMIRNFMNTLRIGEYVSGENAKATGIIGGINNIKSTWTLNWGKIPINDKRLVVIDEASGLSIDDITNLSQMRSEGILSITKIKQESTYARTRLLWITNPRSGKRINEHFWNGYGALKEFMPVQEDLARYDLAVTAAIDDVEDIFDYPNDCPMSEIEVNRWRSLVLFAWGLNAEDIVITEEAEKDIMEKSIQLGNRFNNEPIFMAVNGYEKLARIAIAAAVVTFNYVDGLLQIEPRHVEYAVNLLLRVYGKESFGLLDKVGEDRKTMTMSKSIEEQLNKLEIIYDNLDNLFRDGTVSVNMVPTILGVNKEGADTLISQLYNLGLVEIGDSFNTIKAAPIYLEYIRRRRKNAEEI